MSHFVLCNYCSHLSLIDQMSIWLRCTQGPPRAAPRILPTDGQVSKTTNKWNNYHMTEHTHVPRHPCLFRHLSCAEKKTLESYNFLGEWKVKRDQMTFELCRGITCSHMLIRAFAKNSMFLHCCYQEKWIFPRYNAKLNLTLFSFANPPNWCM